MTTFQIYDTLNIALMFGVSFTYFEKLRTYTTKYATESYPNHHTTKSTFTKGILQYYIEIQHFYENCIV